MNFKASFALALSAAALFAEQPPLFYGNPSECCPPPFRCFTMGDFLYWQASESNLEYAMDAPGSIHEIDYPFQDGFRLGGGVVFAGYDWQLEIDWTRYYHHFRDTAAGSLIALWMHPEGHGYLTFANASLSWDLKFDTLDLDLLRVGFANPNFSLSPFMGLKRAWLNQHLHIVYQKSIAPVSLPYGFYDIRFGNDFRGIGPHLGLDTHLLAGYGFDIAASLSTALLYGTIHCHRIDVSSQWASLDLSEDIERFKPMLQGLIALEWSRCFYDGAFRALFSLGYEAQIWWGQNQLRTYVSSALPPSNFKTNGALTLKGLDFHARFDF